MTNVEAPGQRQLLARRAYLNSSSHTTWSGNTKQYTLVGTIKIGAVFNMYNRVIGNLVDLNQM